MKKIEIKTEKATLLVVDLPNHTTHLMYKGYYVMCSTDKGLNDKCRKISQGDTQGFIKIGNDYKHLGKPSDITEDIWKGIVDKVINRYQDYSDSKVVPTYSLGTATESGLSLLKANGVIYEKQECDVWCCEDGIVDMIHNEPVYCYKCRDNEEKLWSNPHIFIKI